MKKGYNYYLSVLLTGVLVIGFTFATDSLNKNRITKKSDTDHSFKLEQLQNEIQDEGLRDVCDETFIAYGSDDLDGDGENDLCWDDGSGYFYLFWEGGCLATGLEYSGGFLDIASYGFTSGFYFFGFEPGVTEVFIITFDDGNVGASEATNDCATCEELGLITCWDGSCAETLEDCPEEGDCGEGYVLDCDGTFECWPESWIGDGYPDCNDQQYGADLTCYDCDGGDCPEDDPGCEGGSESCEDQGLVTCPDGSCAETMDDCPDCTTLFMNMYDSYGDGWNGASYTISDAGGSVVASGTLDNGSEGTDILCLEAGNYSITVGGGSWDSEITWDITDANGNIIASGAVGTFDFTVGEVESCEDQGLVTCPDGSCAETLDDCPDPDLDPPSNLTATAGDSDITLSWSSPGGGGGGDFPPCPDGSAEYVDCAGVCFNNEDCANDTYDGCVEGQTTWLGDGWCDNGDYGLTFWLPGGECPEYGNDCGDCEAIDDPYGVCSGEPPPPPGDCESIDNFMVVSPEDCYENSNYFEISWEGGCELDFLGFGVDDPSENPFDLTGYGFNESFIFFGFGPSETYVFQIGAGDIMSEVVTATSSSTDCGGGGGGDATCEGYCEDQSPGGCYCDSLCEGYGDCCPDACEFCGYDCGRSEEEQALYDLYHDEYGNRITNPELGIFIKPATLTEEGYGFARLDYGEVSRELNGYNVYRDGEILDYTTDTGFVDGSAMAGTEHCYFVTAVYDEGESAASNTACAEIESSVTPGDVNGDGEINVLDIVIMVNFILDTDDPTPDEAAASDVNGDGEINVLDIVIIVNWILGTNRVESSTTGNASFILNDHSLAIDAESSIGGIQLSVSGDYTITGNSEYDLYEHNGTVLIISLEGKDITGELFNYTGNLELNEVLVANWNGEEVSSSISNAPVNYRLSPAYPNPFNPATTISYSMPETGSVMIAVYDIMGRQIETLVNGTVSSGNHTLTWNGAEFSSGIYYVKMNAGTYSHTQKLLLMK